MADIAITTFMKERFLKSIWLKSFCSESWPNATPNLEDQHLIHSHIIQYSLKKLKSYGHVKRMPEEKLPRITLEWIALGKMKKGRPHGYIQSIKNEEKEDKKTIK